MIVNQEELFLTQAPMFNFELSSDEILQKALEDEFIFTIDDNQYLINEEY